MPGACRSGANHKYGAEIKRALRPIVCLSTDRWGRGDASAAGDHHSFGLPSGECQLALISSIRQRQMRQDCWITKGLTFPPPPCMCVCGRRDCAVYAAINPPNLRTMANLAFVPRTRGLDASERRPWMDGRRRCTQPRSVRSIHSTAVYLIYPFWQDYRS